MGRRLLLRLDVVLTEETGKQGGSSVQYDLAPRARMTSVGNYRYMWHSQTNLEYVVSPRAD